MRDILSITHGIFDVWARWVEVSVYTPVTTIAVPRGYNSSKGGIAPKSQNSITAYDLKRISRGIDKGISKREDKNKELLKNNISYFVLFAIAKDCWLDI